ncbi:MAG: hypothetical protein WKF68_03475 [Daejeonella sp.]
MKKLITCERNALRFLMTEDVYILAEKTLPAFLQPVPDMIQESLAETQKEEVQDPGFNYLGENNRYFLILIEDRTHTELNSTHKELLLKIMTAKGLDIRDLAIVNLAKYDGANFSQLNGFFSCSKIALFGIDPQRISLPSMTVNKSIIHEGVAVLASFSLEEMSSNTDKKRQFWSVMKDF